MAKTHEIEVFILMDEFGATECSTDEDDALSRFDDNIGGAYRKVKIKVRMAAPAVAEANVVIPDEAGEVVAEAVF